MIHPYVLYLGSTNMSYFKCKISNNFFNVKFGADGEAKVLKQRIESINPENNRATYRILEGDLMNEYKSFVVTLRKENLEVLHIATLIMRKSTRRWLTPRLYFNSQSKSPKRSMHISYQRNRGRRFMSLFYISMHLFVCLP